jgi:hypothetical protein
MVQWRAWAQSEVQTAAPSSPANQDIKDLTPTSSSPRKPDPKKQQEMENQLIATDLGLGLMEAALPRPAPSRDARSGSEPRPPDGHAVSTRIL